MPLIGFELRRSELQDKPYTFSDGGILIEPNSSKGWRFHYLPVALCFVVLTPLVEGRTVSCSVSGVNGTHSARFRAEWEGTHIHFHQEH